MDIWNILSQQLESETGYKVVMLPHKDATINDNEIILVIDRIAQGDHPGQYSVNGELAIKYSQAINWQAVTDLLDLCLTGTSATAQMKTYAQGFIAMSVPFCIQVFAPPVQENKIKEVKIL